MHFIDILERRFGRYAIPYLGRMIAVLNALVFGLDRMRPGFAADLDLNPDAIAHGQYWRLVTYIFIPGTDSLLWFVFAVMFLLMVVDGLETVWGAFRLNLFYLLGMIGTTVAAFFFGQGFSNSILNLSLFFAFARFFPDMWIYVLWVLPAKIKWLAWALAALLIWQFVGGPGSYRMAVLASLANYLIFFGPEIVADARHRRYSASRQRKFAARSASEDEPMHRCAVCGRDDRSHPELNFRVAKDGNDYCEEHLGRGSAAKQEI